MAETRQANGVYSTRRSYLNYIEHKAHFSKARPGLKTATAVPVLSGVVVIAAMLSVLFSGPAFAEPRTFEREYTYRAGDDDSKNSSRACALREVKRLLLEELRVYLEAKTEVKDFRISQDEVVTLTAGVVATEVIDEQWDGQSYLSQSAGGGRPGRGGEVHR